MPSETGATANPTQRPSPARPRAPAMTGRRCTVRSSALFGDGVLQAQIFRAVEQFEQLALLDAVDLVARALDLGAAHLITQGFCLGFSLACRLPRSLVELGAVLEPICESRRGS